MIILLLSFLIVALGAILLAVSLLRVARFQRRQGKPIAWVLFAGAVISGLFGAACLAFGVVAIFGAATA